MRRFFISFTGKREREWCNKKKKDRKRNVPILENLSIKKVKLYVPKLLDLSDFFFGNVRFDRNIEHFIFYLLFYFIIVFIIFDVQLF